MGTTFDVPVDVALEHHGILGQKLGVRRFQNADGSLTAAGKMRYGSYESGAKDQVNTRRQQKKMFNTVKRNLGTKELRPLNTNALPDSPEKTEYLEAKKRREESEKFRSDFYADDELSTKYAIKAAKMAYKDYLKDSGWSEQDAINWYLYSDGDQGDNDSFSLYLRDQKKAGTDVDKKWRDLHNAYEDESRAKEKLARSVLGVYADKKITDYSVTRYEKGRKFRPKTTATRGLMYIMQKDHSDNYLMHFGIKGQRWGIRRFQNPDGTLTAAGRARYDTGTALKSLANNVSEHRRERFEKKKEKIVAKGNAKQVSRISSKLTTKELEDAIRRVELTQKINELRVKPTTYKFIGTIANVMRNTSTLGNSFADAADAVKRVKKLFNKVDEESEARKKGRLAGIEEGEKLKAKNEIFPDAKRIKINSVTKTNNLNERINRLTDKETSDITNLARSSKAARLNERIWNLSDADRDQRSPSNPNRNTESYWTQGSPRNSTSYWYTPKVSRDKKPPTVSSAVQSKTALNMRNPINLSLSLTKAGIDLKQLRKERKKTKGQSNSSTDDIGSLNDSLLSANQKKLDEYEKKKKK